jgi:hypothetical protein
VEIGLLSVENMFPEEGMYAANVLFAVLMEMTYVLSPFPFLHHYLQAIVTVYVEFSTVRNNALDFFSLAQLHGKTYLVCFSRNGRKIFNSY